MTPGTRTIVSVIAVLAVAAVVGYGYVNLQGPSVMTGAVVRSGAASVRAQDQLGANDKLVVESATAPADSWLVAYRVGMQGMGGALLGYARVPAGTSTNVSIPIDQDIRLTQYAIIVLNVDRGVRGRFEFDMNRFDTSPDKPYYIGGRAVQTTITVALQENGDTFPMPEVAPTAP